MPKYRLGLFFESFEEIEAESYQAAQKEGDNRAEGIADAAQLDIKEVVVTELDELPVHKYEVFFRDPMSDHRWSYFFQANSFEHAEEQAYDSDIDGGQIIKIEMDYPNEWEQKG